VAEDGISFDYPAFGDRGCGTVEKISGLDLKWDDDFLIFNTGARACPNAVQSQGGAGQLPDEVRLIRRLGFQSKGFWRDTTLNETL
jgi:hypothetical protein